MAKRIKVIVSGPKGDHEVKSPRLSDDDAQQQFQQINQAQANGDQVTLPWLSVLGANVVVASTENAADGPTSLR